MDTSTTCYHTFSIACQMFARAFGVLFAATPGGGDGGMPNLQSLIIGAVGGMASQVLRSILDRFGESHKATIGIAAKRKERYYEKQAAAVASIYEKLTRYMDTVDSLRLYEPASTWGEQPIDESARTYLEEKRGKLIDQGLDEATRARIDFERSFAASEIYFSPSLVSQARDLGRDLHRVILIHRMASLHPLGELPGRDAGDDKAKIQKIKEATNVLISTLKSKFQEMLLGKGVQPD
jgi:hypothetical protein